MGRVRKRPSMLSEFHGKYYNHRDADREISQYGSPKPQPVTLYNRYVPGGYHKSEGLDPRRHPSMYHNVHPNHDQLPNNHQYTDRVGELVAVEEEVVSPVKRPRLYIDLSRHDCMMAEAPTSANSSVSSSTCGPAGGTTTPVLSPSHGPGLSAYLEDINSDDDIQDDEERVKKMPPSVQAGAGKSTKEELLQMMDRVDRDIAATETQIVALLKKKSELEESSRLLTEPPATSGDTISPEATCRDSPSDDEDSTIIEGDDKKLPVKVTLMNTIYAENRLKVKSANAVLHSLHSPSFASNTVLPVYHRPCEAPGYSTVVERHKLFRPKLLLYVQKLKLEHHEKELKLCKEYDQLMLEWKARIEKFENSHRKKARDTKNKELFERMFPELKTKREQMEKFSRVDQRGVRSDAELKELMYELMEQEEAPVRYRRTQAVIPPMDLDNREQSIRFTSNSGLIKDPMALYKESTRIAITWTDEEKRIFRERFLQYPKNFAVISACLPHKTTADCVKYYYLCKKNENFKQLVSKANIRKRKVLFKPHGFTMMPQTPLLISSKQKSIDDVPRGVAPLLEDETTPEVSSKPSPTQNKTLSEHEEWTELEIANLKEGLRKYGKAWGKIYREISATNSKTATQCKQFFDNCPPDIMQELLQALSEHTSIKNAEKARRKAENRKPLSISTEGKGKRSFVCTANDDDSENTESASESEMCSVDSGSESTITDSSPEDHNSVHAMHDIQKSEHDKHSLENNSIAAVITAAEMLMKNENTVSVEVALHDHNYTLPHLLNPVDMPSATGLNLIAAAAAVVSPSLGRNNTNNSKTTCSISPIKAPRGRPPSNQKRSGNHFANKLSPSLLSPAGSSSYVPLTDGKSTVRSRTKSAPVDRPRLPIQCRSPSGIARSSLHSKAGRSIQQTIYSKAPRQLQSNRDLETLVNVALASTSDQPKTSGSVNNAATSFLFALPGAQSSGFQLQCKEVDVNLNSFLLALSIVQQNDLLGKLDSPATSSVYNVALPTTGSMPDNQVVHSSERKVELLSMEGKTASDRSNISLEQNASPTLTISYSDPALPVVEDLSNLNLLSSLVAAVASNQSTSPAASLTVINSNDPNNTKSTDESFATMTTAPPQAAQLGSNVNTSLSMLGTANQATFQCSSSNWPPDLHDFCQPDVLATRLNPLSSSLPSLPTGSTIVTPPFSYPSTSQQQTLLLYTRSLSFPMSPSLAQSVEEEEDHLEIASRSINELSKLLGTSSCEPDGKAGSTLWNATSLPSTLPSCIPSGLSSLVTSTSNLYFTSLDSSSTTYSVLTTSEDTASVNKESR